MKQLWRIAAMLIMTTTVNAAGPEPPCDLNLLRNPGCDEPLVGGEILDWTEAIGSEWTCRSSDPSPASGPGYFSAGQGDAAELTQEIDVSAYTSTGFPFHFSGEVRSRDENPPDLGRVVFEFRGHGGTILGSFDSGDLAPTTNWAGVFQCCEGPPLGTQVVRVRLISTRRSGQENDGFFDNLVVYPICGVPVGKTTWGLIKTTYR